MNKNRLISIAGGLWVIIGLFLVLRGISLFQLAINEQHSTYYAIFISLVAGLAVGTAKGKFVLSKTAKRNRTRIESLAAPLKFHHVFPKPFYAFIVCMMLLGLALRSFNQYLGGYVVVGAIYCGIGAALVVSSRVYRRNNPESTYEQNL